LLVGFCLMTRRDVLGTVGLLDEDLFLGSDDLELCLRLRASGYRLAIARDCYVEHQGGSSFTSESTQRTEAVLRESTAAYRTKLLKAFAPLPVPTSEELWGSGIFPSSK